MSALRLSAAFLLLCIHSSAALADIRIFDLKYRPAAEVADAVQAVLGEKGRVTAVDRSVVVDADASRLETAADLIERLDHPPKLLRVFVSQQSDEAMEKTEADVSGRVVEGSGTVVVVRPDGPPRSGTVIVGDTDDRLRLDASSASDSGAHKVEQFIVTMEGNPARISVGKRIPITERWLKLARRHAYVAENVHYESIATGFEVQPELFGEMVQLAIHPYLAFQSPLHAQEIRFQELTTRITVPLGQWFDLGGVMSGQDEVSRKILGVGRVNSSGSGVVRVRVDLQPE